MIVRSISVVLCVVAMAPSLHAQSAANVAVVVNDASTASRQIAEHYARTRSIPRHQIISIRTSTSEAIDRAEYSTTIEQPIARALQRAGIQDRILYIVLTKGIPLRIEGTAGHAGTRASVDSELTLLYRRMTGRPVPVRGAVANPYFLADRPLEDAKPFSHRDFDIFLVTRLDGFTVDDVLAAIDRGGAPRTDGRIVLDQRASAGSAPDAWLAEAARRVADLTNAGRVLLETSTAAARNDGDVLGYYSWGSNDPANRVRRFGMQFVPGALAALFVSTDARTFTEPDGRWTPSPDGSSQTLTGDLLREGATGVAGNVAEPYLRSAVRPEVLFPAYLAGFNLAEAFYLALPDLGWQTVIVGDPLCRPFAGPAAAAADLDPPLDLDTELPSFFSKRRLDAEGQPGAPPEALLRLLIRAEGRQARGDLPGARQTLESIVAEHPTSKAAQVQLATVESALGNHSAAAERYRALLKDSPNDVVVLNNLAYLLATRLEQPAEAKAFAERAYAAAPASAGVLDTLGWIEYLLGNYDRSKALLTAAIERDMTGVAEIAIHAAHALAAAGDKSEALVQIQRAVRLDPTLDIDVLREQVLERFRAGKVPGPRAKVSLASDSDPFSASAALENKPISAFVVSTYAHEPCGEDFA